MKKILVIMCAMACLVIVGCSSDDEKVLSPEEIKELVNSTTNKLCDGYKFVKRRFASKEEIENMAWPVCVLQQDEYRFAPDGTGVKTSYICDLGELGPDYIEMSGYDKYDTTFTWKLSYQSTLCMEVTKNGNTEIMYGVKVNDDALTWTDGKLNRELTYDQLMSNVNSIKGYRVTDMHGGCELIGSYVCMEYGPCIFSIETPDGVYNGSAVYDYEELDLDYLFSFVGIGTSVELYIYLHVKPALFRSTHNGIYTDDYIEAELKMTTNGQFSSPEYLLVSTITVENDNGKYSMTEKKIDINKLYN